MITSGLAVRVTVLSGSWRGSDSDSGGRRARATSKVTPPAIPAHLVSRSRLSARLDDGAIGPLTLVSAGPGAGKTVLLSDWVSQEALPTGWVAMGATDNEPRRFWGLVGRALAAVGITSDADILAALPHDRDDPTPFLLALIESVPGSAEFALVIDDAHLITDATILAEIDAIIRYGSPRWHLVLSTRSDPLLPLHRYRLAGQMLEIRLDDLAMTKAEAHALLAAHGVALRSAELTLLSARTEGWVAGLRLSAISLAGSRNPSRFVNQLVVDQTTVGEYLIEEVLNRQPAHVRRLLVQTSFLGTVSGPLAAAITGIANSADLLAELSRTNSFVLPHRGKPGSYRYHQLFQEVLRHLLRREYGDELAELRIRAAQWYEDHHDETSALRYAVEAGDWSRAASVLVHGGFARTFVERRDLCGPGLETLLTIEPSSTSSAGELRVAQAAVAVMAGRLALAASRLKQARADSLDADVEATATLVEVVAAQRSNAIASLDRAAAALLDNGHRPDRVRAINGLSVAVRLGQARARLWEDGPGQSLESHLQETTASARRDDLPKLELEALAMLELSYAVSGRSEHARECALRSQALIRKWSALQRTAIHHLAQAIAAHLRTDLAATSRSLRRAQQASDGDPDPCLPTAIALTRARVLLAEGNVAHAKAELAALELSPGLPTQLAHARLQALAEIARSQGRPRAALSLLACGAGSRTAPALAVAEAEAFVALSDAPAAARALRPVLTASDATAPLPLLISAFLVSAKVAELAGDEAKAVEEVLRATGLATGALTLPFVLARPLLSGLLGRHPEAGAAWPRSTTATINLDEPAAAPPVLAEPLTDRETAVLKRLATAMTTGEIGDELGVSINTIKTHIAAIYRKLPAAGRRDAVSRARQLELL